MRCPSFLASADPSHARTFRPLGFRARAERRSASALLAGSAALAFAVTGCARVDTELPGEKAFALEAGEFNGDGRSDLVVGYRSSPSSMTLAALLSRGDGSFDIAPIDDIPGALARDFAVADFDGDGHLDFAVTYRQADGLGATATYLGDGAGNFTRSAHIEEPERPSAVVAGDVDGDGEIDLLIAGIRESASPPGRVVLLPGQGDGRFEVPPGDGQEACVGGVPRSLALTERGQVVTSTTTRVLVHSPEGGDFGDCSGELVFRDPGSDLQDIAAGRLNPGDRHPDLALADGKGRILIFHGDDASFPPELRTRRELKGAPRALALVPLGDAAPPGLALADEGRGTASVHAGLLEETDRAPPFDRLYRPGKGVHTAVTGAPVDIAVADFLGDGTPDIATIGTDEDGASVSVLATGVARPGSP